MEQSAVSTKSYHIPTIVGAVVLGVLAGAGIMWIGQSSFDEYVDESGFSVKQVSGRKALTAEPCVAGKVCEGPTVSAEDPEGDAITFKFFDKTTGEQVGQPIKTESGKPVTPTFKFSDPGDKQLYMVVEDGAGHTSADYPVIIPVTPKN